MSTTQPRLAGDRVKSSVLSQRIFIRDLTLSCSIGVSEEERARRQRLRINIELAVDYPPPSRDTITEVVDYGRLAKAVRNHRSEEHTSELQSLMRTSYAVFCLKKK